MGSRQARAAGAAIAFVLALVGCSSHPAQPQQPDSRNDMCASCRMPISDPSLAAQLVAPNEEPRFFDDLRCLRDYLASERTRPHGEIAYVADHRTREWVRASQAVFASAPSLETPMGSRWVAYADEHSRLADGAAGETSPVSRTEIFGATPPPGS